MKKWFAVSCMILSFVIISCSKTKTPDKSPDPNAKKTGKTGKTGKGKKVAKKSSHDNIEYVMKKAHGKKTGIFFKVKAGSATDDEKKELATLYVLLSEQTPEKGEKANWDMLTAKIVVAANDVVAGKEGAVAALTKAANCKACHDVHQPN